MIRIHGNKGRKKSLEHRMKIRLSNIGLKRSDETRRRISESHKGRPHPHKGSPHTAEHNRKIGESNMGRIGPMVGKKHSAVARKRMSDAQKKLVAAGTHRLWKGGVTTIHQIIRSSVEYKLWRESVFIRDNYTCVWCGARNGNGVTVIFNADHIKPFSQYPELRFSIDNGRTLCIDCHRKTDTYAGRTK